jgi:hypothetical protein
MDIFWILAGTGALGGDSVAPWKATIEDKGDPQMSGNLLQWNFAGCDLDERATIHLVNLLLAAHETSALDEVTIAEPNGSRTVRPIPYEPKLENPYPPRWQETPFFMEVEPLLTDTATVRIHFKHELNSEQVSEISTNFLGWAAAAAVGAYAVAPLSPMSCYIEPDQDVEIDGREMTWGLQKIRLHSAAMDGLTNICLAIDHSIAAIDALWIG